MDAKQRKLAIVTSLGKKYSGMVDVPSETFRTTDLLNSSNIFWKSPNLKCYDNAIFMSDVRLFLDDTAVYKKFDFTQVKLSNIIYFYDDIEGIGDEMEKNGPQQWSGKRTKTSRPLISSQNKLPIPFMISLVDFSVCSRKSLKIILSP